MMNHALCPGCRSIEAFLAAGDDIEEGADIDVEDNADNQVRE